jgi:hypothetical protein
MVDPRYLRVTPLFALSPLFAGLCKEVAWNDDFGG